MNEPSGRGQGIQDGNQKGPQPKFTGVSKFVDYRVVRGLRRKTSSLPEDKTRKYQKQTSKADRGTHGSEHHILRVVGNREHQVLRQSTSEFKIRAETSPVILNMSNSKWAN